MLNTKEMQKILGYYYKSSKTGVFFGNKCEGGKTICFCGEIYNGDNHCPNCGKKSLLRVSDKELGKKRIVSSIKGENFSVVEYKLQVKLKTDKQDVDSVKEYVDIVEYPNTYIRINEGVVETNIRNGKVSEAFNNLYLEELPKYSKWIADYLNIINQTNIRNWGYKSILSKANSIDKLFPKLKKEINQAQQLSYPFIEGVVKYDDSKEIEEMLLIKKPFLKIYNAQYLESFRELSLLATTEEAEMIVAHIENMNINAYNYIRSIFKFGESEDFGFKSIKDFMVLAEKSQVYHSEIFSEVISKYSKEYFALYGKLPEYKLEFPLTSKDTGRISRMYVLQQNHNLPTAEIESVMKLIQDNPTEGLKKLGTYKFNPSNS